MSDVTEVISLCVHVRVQKYTVCEHIILWCGYLRHGTGPPSTHTHRRGARENDGNRVSWSCTMVVITRPADTGIHCVCRVFYTRRPTSYNKYIVYTQGTRGVYIIYILYAGRRCRIHEIGSRVRRRPAGAIENPSCICSFFFFLI